MPTLSLTLLGAFQAALDGRPITGFESNKVRALLAYLVVEADRPHSRDELIGLLWPEQPDATARANLRQALANLRQVIGDRTAQSPFLLVTSDSIQFQHPENSGIDVTAFTTLLAECQAHAHRRLVTCRSCARRLQRAVELYRGDFLAQFVQSDSEAFEEWALVKRERWHHAALEALYALAEYHDRRSEYDREQHYARRQLELDPWREEAHRQVMRALALSGQRSAALNQYERCRRILASELGVEPARETTRLYEHIRDGSNEDELSASTAVVRLPASPTPLVGRECEIAEMVELIENPAHRLVTITGAGGIGKTRLAVAAASELAHAFTHGAAFVSLAALSSVEFLAPSILAALDVSLDGQVDAEAQLHAYLRDRELLLIMDNWEHLLPEGGGVELLAEMLQRAPGLTVLATSRERLRIQAEWLFDLQGLDYPKGESATELESYDAIRLFVQRARQAQRRPALDQADLVAIARICQLVEGLPLAINLAAASADVRSCAEIAGEIEASLLGLKSRFRDAPERHRSVWAAFEHSWNLLSERERRVLRQVSVFRGGWQVESAAQVAGASLETLTALVDKSLLRHDVSGRFDMHELVRQYAGDKLKQAGETEPTRHQHLEFFRELAEAAEMKLEGSEQVQWIDRLKREYGNLEAALQWALDQSVAEVALQMSSALGQFWEIYGNVAEGRQWLRRALALSAPTSDTVRAKALKAAGRLAFEQRDMPAAQALFEAGLELYYGVEAHADVAALLNNLGNVAWFQGDYPQAHIRYEHALALRRELGDQRGIAGVLNGLGLVAFSQNDLEHAAQYLEQSLSMMEALGDRKGRADAFFNLGLVLLRLESGMGRAIECFEASVALCRELGYLRTAAYALNNLAMLILHQGNAPRAAALASDSLALCRELDDGMGAFYALINLGHSALDQGDLGQAVRAFQECRELLGPMDDLSRRECTAWLAEGLAHVDVVRAHDTLAVHLAAAAAMARESNHFVLPPTTRTYLELRLARVRTRLGESAFASAWVEGRAMTPEQAIRIALEN
ncbi:MAG TPA: BTAD domain-containing putative transcriptional regulator [Anaerolineae bacterium]|nr:BTAD domain-containing putative transcriptional regulator [Anaerolineae bacterium]